MEPRKALTQPIIVTEGSLSPPGDLPRRQLLGLLADIPDIIEDSLSPPGSPPRLQLSDILLGIPDISSVIIQAPHRRIRMTPQHSPKKGEGTEWSVTTDETSQEDSLEAPSEIDSLFVEPESNWQGKPSSPPDDYLEWLHAAAYHLMLMALVFPNAVNAFCEPSSVKPADLSADWWNNLSTEMRTLSIINGLCGMGVNVFVQRDFIPQAMKQLRNSFKTCLTGPTEFLGNSLILVSSFTAAFSFSAISYEALKSLGDIVPIFSALASLSTTFMTRYPSVKKATQRARLFFNKDQRFQKEIADRLRRLKPQHAKTLTALVKDQHFKLQDHDLAQLMVQLGQATEAISLHHLLRPETRLDSFKKYAWPALETSFSFLIVSTAFQTFTQKGFDGANVVAHLTQHSLDDLTVFEKFSIGGTGGTVSAMLYTLAALNLLPTLHYVGSELFWGLVQAGKRLACHPIETTRETFANPQALLRFLKLSLASLAVWRSSGAMTTVGNGVVHNHKGIFWSLFEALPFYKKIFPALNGLGGFAINGTATINQVLKQEREEKRINPQLEDIARHLEELPLPPTLEVEEDGEVREVPTISFLKEFSLFQPAAFKARRPASIEMMNPFDRDSDYDSAGEEDLLLGGSSP